MAGYDRKLLRVNLTTGAVNEEVIPDDVAMNFVGGRGFGIKYLYDEVAPGVDPLSPENKLLFVTGPLAGTGASSTSRWFVATKAPLTGIYTRGAGGQDFAAWMKFAGFELIIIEGRAEEPVYLYIEDGSYKLLDASKLWGKGTVETQEMLQEIHGEDIRTVCIGPSGEKLVLLANVVSGSRTAGRGGAGAVMGSKNLKAVVLNPSKREVAVPPDFQALIDEQIIAWKASPQFEHFRKYGVTGQPEMLNAQGFAAVRNFREGHFDGMDDVNEKAFEKVYLGQSGCYDCIIRCQWVTRVKKGPYAGLIHEGPRGESIWAFTSSIASSDIGAAIAAEALATDLGIDTISVGNTIGFAYELYEKGILTSKDCDGLELDYGNSEAMMELLKKMGNREGFGDLLAEGALRAAEKIGKGSEAYAMQVKGLELPMYEPRAAKAQGFAYAVSNIGGSHCLGYSIQEVFGAPFPRPVDRFAEEGKGELTKFNQDWLTLIEFGIFCLFPGVMGMLTPLLAAKLISGVTEVPEFGQPGYLFRAAERVYDLERAFLVREGMNRKDDTLPKRFLTEPLKKGGLGEGQVVRNQDGMLNEYYKARGWTSNGIPVPQKLRELGLESVAKEMERFID